MAARCPRLQDTRVGWRARRAHRGYGMRLAWSSRDRPCAGASTKECLMNARFLLAACGAAAMLLVTAAHADTLGEIRKRGEMVVGMEAALVPYEFFSDGQIVGYD